MWKKLLKYREVAKYFHRVDVKNGENTSFWFDNWSRLGRIFDITGPRGHIDMGISPTATVSSVLRTHRTRRHRMEGLNSIEAELSERLQRGAEEGEDVSLWKNAENNYLKRFSTKATWKLLRESQPRREWYKGVWFSHATPKYAFITWLAINNRLTTGDRMRSWNTGQRLDCVLCGDPEETRNHLFFSCSYATEIWRKLSRKVLTTEYTNDWDSLVALLHSSRLDHLKLFLFRYAFQSTLYHIWREHHRRHGETPNSAQRIIKMVDKK